MKRKKYVIPTMRVRPLMTEGAVLYEGSFDTNNDQHLGGNPFAKEGSDLNYHPEFKSVWDKWHKAKTFY